MKIGFLVNPWAGIGGTVALKGSDGSQARAQAIAMGAIPRAQQKAVVMLQSFLRHWQQNTDILWYTVAGQMGEAVLRQQLPDTAVIHVQARPAPTQTEAHDTHQAVRWFQQQAVDLIIFAGGDGTARDVCKINQSAIPVLGIPAGVKIHSGVFAVTPHAAGEVLARLLDGKITELRLEDVRDIDEVAFRNNQVRARRYGEMRIPVAGEFMQHVKMGGIESDALVLNDIAQWLVELLDDQIIYFVGSGNSTATLMQQMNLPNTLLGVDAIQAGRLVKADCTEADILQLISRHRCQLIISIIGGQGHIFGRGNAQFSASILNQLKREDLLLIGSKNKLQSLQGRPLLVDSGSVALDRKWAGLIPVITGYDNRVLYPVVAL